MKKMLSVLVLMLFVAATSFAGGGAEVSVKERATEAEAVAGTTDDEAYIVEQKLEADIAVEPQGRPEGVDYLYSEPLEVERSYLIQPGDLLNIRTIDGPELSNQMMSVRVSAKGTIKFPYLDEIFVVGLTEDDLAGKMENALKEFFAAPQIYVLVLESGANIAIPGKYDMFGEIKMPGKYKLTEDLTVADAVLLAGGFTEFASEDGVKVIREIDGKRTSIRVPVGKVYRTGNRTKDVLIQEGDVIVVPESWF